MNQFMEKTQFDQFYKYCQEQNIDLDTVYLIVDSARDKSIFHTLDLTVQHKGGLFEEEFLADLGDVSPYLLKYNYNIDFFKWFINNYIEKNCGVLLTSPVMETTLLRHCRDIFNATNETGEEFFFRYYNNYTLNAYLSTCTEEQRKTFLGPIDSFILNNENRYIRISLHHYNKKNILPLDGS